MLVQMGMAGNDVVMVQQALQAAGYTGIVVDGIFGPLTQQAVLDFQRADGWPTTGIVDDALYGRLQEIAGMLIVSRAQTGQPIVQVPYNPVYGPYLPDPVVTQPGTQYSTGGVPITGGVPTIRTTVSTPIQGMSTAMMIGIALLGVTLYTVYNKRALA